jgi:alkanesulfonate monooxygenase SsuD/methylene tetrahydromethanopterin reductase-like flavin-dependent oxidoreductase (luciferase family)
MAVKFGVFVPQGWRMDLAEIPDPIAKYEAMTNVAKVADEGGWDSIWVYERPHSQNDRSSRLLVGGRSL